MTQHGAPAETIRHIVIVGGGTAGWMSAAFLTNFFKPHQMKITLIESPEIGTVGVGEATIPPISFFNQAVGINEAEFMSATQASFKLGIEFCGWRHDGHSYMHPFGTYGSPINGVSFHAYWLRARALGYKPDLSEFSMSNVAATKNRFDRAAPNSRDPRAAMAHAYHFDASLYARYLRTLAEGRGIRRIAGTITSVGQNPHDGTIEYVSLSDGQRVEGDYFIDCSGFRGLLIEQTLKAGYEDWSDMLPANRAVAVPSARFEAPVPYTRATALKAGWQWRIPLQHRTGNGYVYVSDYISDDEAAQTLLANLGSEHPHNKALAEPRFLRFTTGRRKVSRMKNVVAIGLSSGFLEPLESTSIHLIQHGLIKFAATFPMSKNDEVSARLYNRIMAEELEQIRDFLILHYHANAREGEPLWDYLRHMPIPDSLREKLSLFETRGLAIFPNQTIFQEPNWLAVLMGQGPQPKGYDPLADSIPERDLIAALERVRTLCAQTTDRMPAHDEVLKRYCAAPSLDEIA
ncbi:tryptophan halogenase family protein [Asticcacaulis machinosus]|uniref:Tryptophan 7-halogenase n=1 Tax=Asticcacaulis machinosus TaxID=2984211 RepID=A0ABT5HG59_9CAUL|nr:tryptophan halogenase family protein [Asticcacaulis machinosus]MDC7675071.1 tryptophan 7-halogenase [Asticcacaulis machinosus]